VPQLHRSVRTNRCALASLTETIETTAPAVLPTNGSQPAPSVPLDVPVLVVTPVEERKTKADAAALTLRQPITRRSNVLTIHVPVLRMTAVAAPFSLADVTETDAFFTLGASLAADSSERRSHHFSTPSSEGSIPGPSRCSPPISIVRAHAWSDWSRPNNAK